MCDARANPPVSQYSWRRKSDNDFRIDNNTLTLRNVGRDDADTYVCLATNVLTPTGQADKTMTVGFEMEVFVYCKCSAVQDDVVQKSTTSAYS